MKKIIVIRVLLSLLFISVFLSACDNQLMNAIVTDIANFKNPAKFTVSTPEGELTIGGNLPFVDMWTGESTADKTVTIMNSGMETMTLTDFLITGDSADFTVDTTGTTMILGGGEQTTLTIAFNPQTTGDKNLNIDIRTENSGNFSLSLTGEGMLNVYMPNYRSTSSCLDSAGNIYVAGYVHNGVSNDWFVKKFDPDGNEILTGWEIQEDESIIAETAYKISVDSGDNVYVVGYGENIVLTDSEHDWWIRKYSSSGTPRWNVEYDYTKGTQEGKTISTGDLASVYFGGETKYWTTENEYYWILKKYNFEGVEDPNWNIQVPVSDSAKLYDSIYYDSVFTGSDLDRIVFCGTDNNDWRILSYETDGTLSWEKSFDAEGANDVAFSMALYGSSLFIAGFGTSAADSSDMYFWIKKISVSTGIEDSLWNKQFNRNEFDWAQSIAIGESGNVYVSGFSNHLIMNTGAQSNNDWYLKKLDSSGIEVDLGGSGLSAGKQGLSPCTTNNLDIGIDGNRGSDQLHDILINDSTNRIYLIGTYDTGFSIRTLNDE